MADRSSAEIFGMMFIKLAGDPTAQHTKWARSLWRQSFDYDFSPEQMYCDVALRKLGLARLAVDPEYPEDGKVTIYANERGRFPKGRR